MNWRNIAAVAFCMVATPAWAQTHRVEKPQVVVRAVGVYEWTGDLAKPDASRLIPVTVYIDSTLRDAGVYLARPVPFALETGTIFDLDQSGTLKGTLELAFARHLEPGAEANGDTPYDDGWFGYGAYKPVPTMKVKAPTKLRQSNVQVAVNGKVDADRPSFAKKPGADTSSTSTTSADPDRPTMKRKDGSATASDSTSSSSTPADDPDRPTMKRKSDSTPTSTDTATTASSTPADDADRPTMRRRSDADSTASAGSTPANDPDRPTLKKRSPEDAKQAAKERSQSGVMSTGSLNDDPNRPTMKRGKPAGAIGEGDLTKLLGLPKDLHQMVAVSDAVTRPEHNFTKPWDDDQQRKVILGKMQEFARAKLLAYAGTTAPAPVPAAAAPARPATAAARRRAAAKAAAVTPSVDPLNEESLNGYELSYGGAPTYVYTASSNLAASGYAPVRYVTVVAQADGLEELKVAMSSVTDAQHLDRVPRMRLVDAVDVEASNRASLLMELRAQHSRQFAIYRVIGAQSQQIFLTGSTQ